MKNTNNLNIVNPIASYSDLSNQKYKFFLENKQKSGIYCFTNKQTGHRYIGSSTNLAKRFVNYFSENLLLKITNKSKSIICSSLLKNGLSNFTLDILEYCDSKDVVSREQYYFDLLSPEYNILKKAYSPLGYKHTEEALEKMRTVPRKKFSEETLKLLQSHLAKVNSDKGSKVVVFDNNTKIAQTYDSIRKASVSTKLDTRSLVKIDNSLRDKSINSINDLYRNRFWVRILKAGETINTFNNQIESLKVLLPCSSAAPMTVQEAWTTNSRSEFKGLSLKTVVVNIQTNETKEYSSIRKAAMCLNTSCPTLHRYIKSTNIFQNLYKISLK